MFTIHVLATLFSFGVVWKADKEALAWVRGKKETLSEKRMRTYHILMWVGLVALVVTGSILSYPMLGYLLSRPLFIMKILFVAVLFLNAILIGRMMRTATTQAFATLQWNDRLPLMISGAASSISWVGALVLALVLFS